MRECAIYVDESHETNGRPGHGKGVDSRPLNDPPIMSLNLFFTSAMSKVVYLHLGSKSDISSIARGQI